MNESQIMKWIRKQLGETTAVVHHEDPFRVLISTVLSQRTRDANTEKATKQLFAKYNTPKKIAGAKARELQQLIKPSGFYRVKAKVIQRISKQLLEAFGGRVPKTLEELLSLHGVGRKTANCVLVYAFNQPAIPVDTHVHRISNRLGWVRTNKPEKTEQALMKLVPRKDWLELNDLFVKFGQRVCLPRSPKCGQCSVSAECRFFNSRKTN